MTIEKKDIPPSGETSDDDDDLFADSDDEKTKIEDEPPKSSSGVTKSIVAAITIEAPPIKAESPVKEEATATPIDPKPAEEVSNTNLASIPRKSASTSSPKSSVSSSLKQEPSSSPIPKKPTSSLAAVVATSDAPAAYGLPKGTIIPASIREDIMRQSGGKLLETLRGLGDVNLINDALQEYDDAVQLKGSEIRNHGAYLFGVVKRYVAVKERALRSGGASVPMGQELTPPVHQRLQKLVKDGFCTPEELTKNEKVQSKLRMLSEKDALAAIEEMASVDRSSVRNFGSYFMGILNRYMRGGNQPQSAIANSNNQFNKGGRGRANMKQDPHEMYRRERSRDRSNSGEQSHYGPRNSHGNNKNSHLPNYDTRRNGRPSYYGNASADNSQHQYPPSSKHNPNQYQNNNGPPPTGRHPPPPPPPPPRQSAGMPPPPPAQYQATQQVTQIQQPQQPPSHYGAPPPQQQQQLATNNYGQQQPQVAPPQQQPYGAKQPNTYYGGQRQPQQQTYGSAVPNPYPGAPATAPQQQQMGARQSINSYPPQQQQQQQQAPSHWQGSNAPGGTSLPAGIVDIIGIADKAASAVQALQNQNRMQNAPQQQQQQAQIQQQHHHHQPSYTPPQQQQQSYHSKQSYQQQPPQSMPPPQQQQQYQPPQQQPPPPPPGGNQYNQYGASTPAAAPYSNVAPAPYASHQSPPMGQPNQHHRYQNQQQQQQQSHNHNQGPPYMGGHHPPPPPQGYSQHQPPPQHPSSHHRGNRHGRGKPRRTITIARMNELPMNVQNVIHQIQNTRQVDGPLDEGILGMVKDLPEHLALQSLQKFIAIDKNSMRSKTAYLAGVLRRELERIHRR